MQILLPLLLPLVVLSAARPPPKRPNVLYVVVDDLRNELPIYGQDYIHAPNLEALAK